MTVVNRTLLILWASPGSLVGLCIGLLSLVSGGRVQLHTGVLEFYGGAAKAFLQRMPIGSVMAITFGHVVLGQTQAALDLTRTHERIHVRQYELWGPIFIPAYLYFSALLWFQGKDAYRENPFEIEAYENS
jgi:hypothetical protein